MMKVKVLPLLIVFIAINSAAHSQAKADSLLDFITKNKSRAALYITKNDTILARQNENKLMPLASTVKILVAVEFAKQAGSNVIDENSYISLNELDKYYIANTDGGVHPAWIAYERTKNHIRQDSVQLLDVARGMMMFSSNANTEFLMDLLGLDNVKNNIQLFGLHQHTAIFPLVSSLFLYQNPNKAKEASILKSIKNLTEEGYCKIIYQIHNALKYDTVLKKKFRPEDLTENMQKLWSDKLTASSVKTYNHLCNILNRRLYLDANSYGVLAEVLEYIMENPLNMKIYKHFGLKNGSTTFVLTEAFYASMQNDDKYEVAYFFNDLTVQENEQLQGWMNDFRIGITQRESFRKKVTAVFNK